MVDPANAGLGPFGPKLWKQRLGKKKWLPFARELAKVAFGPQQKSNPLWMNKSALRRTWAPKLYSL